jgi:hypothetical protein
MAVSRPWASYRNQQGSDVEKTYKTYAALRKEMRAMMNDSEDNIVEVIRTRRGEWGQWFERWSVNQRTNKLEKIEDTWL